jgi:Aminotransferase class-V
VAEDAPPSKLAPAAQPYGRVFNFAAGPAILPVPVLEQAQADLLNYKGSGMSVMEMSHRSKVFDGIIKQAERDLRTLLSIPDNYKVLPLWCGSVPCFPSLTLAWCFPAHAPGTLLCTSDNYKVLPLWCGRVPCFPSLTTTRCYPSDAAAYPASNPTGIGCFPSQCVGVTLLSIPDNHMVLPF